MFMVGPPEGWRMAAATLLPRLPRPSVNPMVEVDLPSPRGVGRDGGDIDVFTVRGAFFPAPKLS